MKKVPVFKILIAAIIHIALFVVGSVCGLIHPACYAFVGTILPILFAFVYLYVCANMRCFGAALSLNGFALIVGLIAGEGNLPLIIGLIGLALIAELIRKLKGYETLKGVRWSFIPFAFSFYAYAFHWWTDTEASLAEALEEMPAGYADKMASVIGDVRLLIVMLILVIPIAMLAMRLAEKVMKKQTAKLR